ncbi:hypothetical protein P5V15_007739 [Pogonomyrmex californicus]
MTVCCRSRTAILPEPVTRRVQPPPPPPSPPPPPPPPPPPSSSSSSSSLPPPSLLSRHRPRFRRPPLEIPRPWESPSARPAILGTVKPPAWILTSVSQSSSDRGTVCLARERRREFIA